MSCLQQNWRRGQNKQVLPGREGGWVSGDREPGVEMAQTMYAYMNK
jgi:hypothetical protein